MNEEKASVMAEEKPDLSLPPHVLPLVMEVFAGEWQQALCQQEQLLAHLATCPFCRTAVVVLLAVAQEYDRRSGDSEEPAHDLCVRFAAIGCAIEACGYEHLGAYAEAIVAQGREEAEKRFPLLAEHLSRCPSCTSALEGTLAFLNEPDEIG